MATRHSPHAEDTHLTLSLASGMGWGGGLWKDRRRQAPHHQGESYIRMLLLGSSGRLLLGRYLGERLQQSQGATFTKPRSPVSSSVVRA